MGSFLATWFRRALDLDLYSMFTGNRSNDDTVSYDQDDEVENNVKSEDGSEYIDETDEGLDDMVDSEEKHICGSVSDSDNKKDVTEQGDREQMLEDLVKAADSIAFAVAAPDSFPEKPLRIIRILDEHTSLLIYSHYECGPFGFDTWYRLDPDGEVTRSESCPFCPGSEAAQFG